MNTARIDQGKWRRGARVNTGEGGAETRQVASWGHFPLTGDPGQGPEHKRKEGSGLRKRADGITAQKDLRSLHSQRKNISRERVCISSREGKKKAYPEERERDSHGIKKERGHPFFFMGGKEEA